jgi:hypothetical protein
MFVSDFEEEEATMEKRARKRKKKARGYHEMLAFPADKPPAKLFAAPKQLHDMVMGGEKTHKTYTDEWKAQRNDKHARFIVKTNKLSAPPEQIKRSLDSRIRHSKSPEHEVQAHTIELSRENLSRLELETSRKAKPQEILGSNISSTVPSRPAIADRPSRPYGPGLESTADQTSNSFIVEDRPARNTGDWRSSDAMKRMEEEAGTRHWDSFLPNTEP